MLEPFLELIADFVFEAIVEGFAYVLVKGLEFTQDLWAMLMGR